MSGYYSCENLTCSETEVRRGTQSDRNLDKQSSSEDELEKEAQQRLIDLKERDEYAERVKGRDKEKTKHKMSKSEHKVRFLRP